MPTATRIVYGTATALNATEEAFAQLVAEGMGYVEAYLKAKPETKANKKSLQECASAMANRPRVKQRIEALRLRKLEQVKAEIDTDRVLQEIASIAFSDVGSLFDAFGNLKDVNELTPAERACIASIEVKSEYTDKETGVTTVIRKINLWNKNDSLEKLAKHLGLYAADNAQKSVSRLADLPRPLREQILKHLDELAHAGLAQEPAAGSSPRLTH